MEDMYTCIHKKCREENEDSFCHLCVEYYTIEKKAENEDKEHIIVSL